jgi:two-component system sensor histidine kinase KdpD
VLENAAKYAPEGTPIRITATSHDGRVSLEVQDTGIGIAGDELELIFGQFYRADMRDTKAAGTGLGLAICRAFIEANGGRIEALSAGLGHGATFRITLPVPVPVMSIAADRDE